MPSAYCEIATNASKNSYRLAIAAFSLVAPAIVVTWFVWAALQSPTKDPENWAWYVAALFPLEGVRLLSTQLMRDAYQNTESPWRATTYFLVVLK